MVRPTHSVDSDRMLQIRFPFFPLFSRSGKCQVGQKPLTETHGGKREQIEDHCLEGEERGRATFAACVFVRKNNRREKKETVR